MIINFNLFSFLIRFLILLFVVNSGDGNVKIEIEGGFENGLFLQLPQNEGSVNHISSPSSQIRHFTPLQRFHSIFVKASIGSISAREKINPSSFLSSLPPSSSSTLSSNHSQSPLQNPVVLLDTISYKDEITAHLVTPSISRNSPVFRILFHFGLANSGLESSTSIVNTESVICAIVFVTKNDQVLNGTCLSSKAKDGACLTSITLPASWWPPINIDSSSKKGQKSTHAKVSYRIVHNSQCIIPSANQIDSDLTQSNIDVGQIKLTPFLGDYEEVTNDDSVRILIPQVPTYSNAQIYVPVLFRYNPNYPLSAFRIRAKVKSGFKIIDAQLASSSPWQIKLEINSKQTYATVTAFLKDQELQSDNFQSDKAEDIFTSFSQEVYSFLFQIDENINYTDTGRIAWSVDYITDESLSSSIASSKFLDRDNSKLSSRLDIQKDEIQTVIGVTSSPTMINTAVLTGKQVSQPLRIYVVSHSGNIGDVTLQSSCKSSDESTIKVSPSCTSAYLDGSEVRGSHNATILITYGVYTGHANFIIWMPKLPVDIKVSDSKLSQIKSWKIPHLKRKARSNAINYKTLLHRSNQVFQKREVANFDENSNDISCRLKYQQAYITVYTQFFSSDHKSGRESSLLSRKIYIEITELVLSHLRLTDSKVALLRGNIIEGLTSGRTEIQAISPITAKLIGAREVRVTNDKEAITDLKVNLVSKISLQVKPEPSYAHVWTIKADFVSKLIAQYQEAILDVKVHYSDQTWVSLSDLLDTHYHFSVDTFDRNETAYAPISGLNFPRIIAIDEAKDRSKDQFINVFLDVNSQCQKKRTQHLAMSNVKIDVDFNPASNHLQNDGAKISKTIWNSLSGISNQARENSINGDFNHPRVSDIKDKQNGFTSLEIGMYALLGIFVLSGVGFFVSYFIFSFTYKKTPPSAAAVVTTLCEQSTSNQKVASNVNDWVWLGKSALPKSLNKDHNCHNLQTFSDSNGQPVLSVYQTQDSKNGNKNQKNTISYPGSEISIQITSNLINEENQAGNTKLKSTSTPKSDFNMTLRDKPRPVSSHTKNDNSNCTYSKDYNPDDIIIIPSHNPPHLAPRHSKHIRQKPNRSVTQNMSSSSNPPPIPPHKNKPSSNEYKPPIPLHGTATSSASPALSSRSSKKVEKVRK